MPGVDYRTRNAALLVVAESPAGTEGSPAAASNAVRTIGGVPFTPNFDKLDTNYAQASISDSPPIVGGGMTGFTPSLYLTGAAAAGQAPDYGILLRGCSMQETLTAADVAGTAQAGAAGTLTLAAGASAVTDVYKGMPLELTGGTGSGQRRVITAYNGTTKVASVYPNWTVTPDATSVYAVRKNARYVPISQSQEALTMWGYQRNAASGGQARRRRSVGSMGSFSGNIKPRGLAQVDFKFQGQLPATPDDVADITPVFSGPDPRPFLNASAFLGGAAIKFNSFSFDYGAQVKNFDDPGATYGYDICAITERTMSGTIVPPLSLISARDSFSDWLGSVSKPLWLCWGALGSGVSLYWPGIRYTGNAPGDVDGFPTESLPWQATGLDSELYISIF